MMVFIAWFYNLGPGIIFNLLGYIFLSIVLLIIFGAIFGNTASQVAFIMPYIIYLIDIVVKFVKFYFDPKNKYLILQYKKDYKNLLDQVKKELLNDPDNLNLLFRKADSLFYLQLNEEAINEYLKICKMLNDNNVDALMEKNV